MLASAVCVATPGRWWMPPNGALHGSMLDRQMAIALACMAGLALVAQGIAAVALLRRPRHDIKSFSVWHAVTFFAVAALFFGLAVRAENLWAASRFQGAAYDALQVEVVGQQFQWYFRYPGKDAMFGVVRPELMDAAAGNPLGQDAKDPAGRDDFVSSKLVLPENREVNLRVRSLDVVHGFSIPGMRVKQDAVPGSVFAVHFTPVKRGVYDIVCSQVCGSGHYRMGAELEVVSAGDYQAWLAKHEPRQPETAP